MEKLNLNDFISNNINTEQEQLDSNDLVSLIAISELTNLEKIKTISRIKPEQVPILTKLYLFQEIYGIDFVKNIADNILQLQISINGLGRKEYVQLVQQRGESVPEKTGLFHRNKDIFR